LPEKSYEFQNALEKSLKYPSNNGKKAVCKSFTLTQDYINDIVFGMELSDNNLNKKLLSVRIGKIYFNFS